MSMTREEAIEIFEQKGWWIAQKETLTSKQAEEIIKLNNAVNFALSALRPVTREQVEKVFSGCPACNDRRCTSCRCFGWYEEVCRKCENQSGYQPLKFCPYCGKPLRDEAVRMVMERMEKLYEQTSN